MIQNIYSTEEMKKAVKVGSVLKAEGYDAYFVGGCVRDMLLGRKPHDYDITTDALPDNVEAVFANAGMKTFPLGKKFGTITVQLGEDGYEVTTYRADGSYIGHQPQNVTFVRNLEADLARRDFTMNAVAKDCMTGELADPFGGVKDIGNKIIRAVGDPCARFTEDPLRILRAVRFAVTLGFTIEEGTSRAMLECREGLKNISKERITEELRKTFESGRPVRNVFMKYRDIIGEILPCLKPCFDFNQNNKYHTHDVYEHILNVVDNIKTPDFTLKLAALLHDVGKPESYSEDEAGAGHFYGHAEVSKVLAEKALTEDLRVPNDTRNVVLALIGEHDMELSASAKSARKFLNRHSREFAAQLCELKGADAADHINMRAGVTPEKFLQIIDEEIAKKSCISIKDLAVNGKDVMDTCCIAPGPEVGRILDCTLEAVINGDIANERNDLLKFAEVCSCMHELETDLEISISECASAKSDSASVKSDKKQKTAAER